jgi:hypothetical protein
VIPRLDGAPKQPEPADSVTLVVRAGDGSVVRREPMKWVAAGYLAVLNRVEPESHDLTVEIVVDGVTLEADGPTLDP